MHLSRRLQRVAANVLSGGVVADIGCDHGFTSIYLVQSGRADRAIAMDINRGPLESAGKHIRQYGLSDRISLRLSDGAEQLHKGEADTILISGMGGALIRRILLDSREVVAAAGELVLSPQSEIFLVRRCLHDIGFSIASEEMVSEQEKYYVIIRAVPGAERYDEEIDYLYGKKLIEESDSVFLRFMEKEQSRVEKVLQKLEYQELSPEGAKRKEGLLREREQIAAVRNKMIGVSKQGDS